MGKVQSLFRFQSLNIWKLANEIGDELFDLADELKRRKLYRFAEQLRGASLSVSYNIAEGAGSDSAKDFGRFLNYARRSVFENANMILMLVRRNLAEESQADVLLGKLVVLSKQITQFKRCP